MARAELPDALVARAFCDVGVPFVGVGLTPRILQAAHEQRVPDGDVSMYLATQNIRSVPILGVRKSGRVLSWGVTQVHECEHPCISPWVKVTRVRGLAIAGAPMPRDARRKGCVGDFRNSIRGCSSQVCGAWLWQRMSSPGIGLFSCLLFGIRGSVSLLSDAEVLGQN